MTKISRDPIRRSSGIEKVFVTSPFIPQTLSKRKRSLESHYPTFFFGCSQLPQRGNVGGNNEMHSRDSKSWEWGITLTASLLPPFQRNGAHLLSLHRTGTPPFQGQLCIKRRKRGISNDSDRRRNAEEKLYQLQCTPPAYHAGGLAEAHRMP